MMDSCVLPQSSLGNLADQSVDLVGEMFTVYSTNFFHSRLILKRGEL